MEEIGLAHGIFRFLHLLLFVYWLGGDAGVFYSSTFVVNPSLTREARLTAAKIFINLDMIPRYCMALMLTVGGVLAELIGITHTLWEMVAIVLLGPVWLAMVLIVHAKEGTAAGKTLARLDLWFRWIVIASILASVVHSEMVGRLDGQFWFQAKLVVFAFLIFCGLMIRRLLPPFSQGFRTLVATGATPESDRLMIEGLAACRPYVLMIWAGILVEALLGILKP
ncbi:MAG: hypothetical protein KA224_01165 [Steroidobacteraceae bacterium]|nr:hypothetical protein [Steroidobacteraceae bacterium]MCC7199207.1 hypothetical protein [Gammaproteobacteria bacterium]